MTENTAIPPEPEEQEPLDETELGERLRKLGTRRPTMASELADILKRVSALDHSVGDELRRQIDDLTNRRANGLNFERHLPEQVALVGRPISLGDKVKFIPERGSTDVESSATWVVTKLTGPKGKKVAELYDRATDETTTREVDNLVFVADFRDPIYPGLKSTGRVERGGDDKPFHTVINSENYHALEALTFTHAGQVDLIYLDPPYNTRAKDWKYNNDYVDPSDAYAHSKWLFFMERRLKIAKKLLNPGNSVLIVTIDEKEFLRLGMLLEQTFPSAKQQMVTTIIAPGGQPRANQMSRVEEYIFILYFGTAKVGQELPAEGVSANEPDEEFVPVTVQWESLVRRGTSARRIDRENQFYPIFVDPDTRRIVDIGDALLPVSLDRSSVDTPQGLEVVWPLRKDGSEGRWRISAKAARALHEQGFLRAGRVNAKTGRRAISYVLRSDLARIDAGEIMVSGHAADGTALLHRTTSTSSVAGTPKTVWNKESHNAGNYGTALVSQFLPGRYFPFPKSLYAVEDTLRLFVKDKPAAIILDFFSGSGTTAHAVMRLNRQDGGRRRSISVTNNEVSIEEHKALVAAKRRPGDEAWEALGICEHVTKPRVEAAITGVTHQGTAIEGEYQFTDVFPMADGLDENVEFFTLTYLSPQLVELDMAFASIAPLLWMRAGAQGRRIDERTHTFDVADTYAVLFELDHSSAFIDAVERAEGLRVAYIVTDDEPQFQAVAAQLPEGIKPVRLYESYLRTFQINTERA